MSGQVAVRTGGLVVENTADANLSFTIRNTDNYITFNNDNIDCYNSIGDTGRILNLNAYANQYVKSHSLVDTATNTLTGGYTLDVVDSAIIRQNLTVNGNIDLATDLNLDGENANISNANGLTFYKSSTDARNVMTVAKDSGKLRFTSFEIDAYNANDTSQQLFLNTHNNNAARCNKLGVGANAGVDTFNCSGGNAYFNATCSYQQACTVNNDILIWNNSKIYRRADIKFNINRRD